MRIIDIHTHGLAGFDTRTTAEEHILEIAERQGSFGVSEIILTIYPATINVMRQNMEVVRKAMERQTASGVEHQASGVKASRILGVHLEGPFLNPSHCGALNAMVFLEPAEYHMQELMDGFEDIIKIITIAPELDGGLRAIKKIADRGIIPSMGHSAATYSEAERGFNAGARGVTHLFNAMRPFHHREPGLAGFGLMHPGVYVEVIADPYHLHRAAIDLVFKVKDPSRIIIISDSVRESKMGGHAQGVVDHSGRLLGGSMTVMESAARLIEAGFNEGAVMNCVSENPSRYLGG